MSGSEICAIVAIVCFVLLGIKAVCREKWAEANSAFCCVIWATMYLVK